MHLDDIESETTPRVEQYLSKIKVIRKVANKIIDFLSQLENFQKALWLKKKFVVSTDYCLTLDRIEESFYPEIATNEAQREEWVRLFAIDEIKSTPSDLVTAEIPGYSNPLTAGFLKANDKLVLDTKFFTPDFKNRLIASIENIDAQTNGLLVHSENFQALNLLQERYREQVKCIYIDPPYNTEKDRAEGKFLYKDSYEHSSWCGFIVQTLYSLRGMMQKNGILLSSIDDNEYVNLSLLLAQVFSKENVLTPFIWKRKAGGGDDSEHLAAEHEYICVTAKNSDFLDLNRIQHESAAMTAKYNKVENGRRYYLERLDKTSLTYSASMDFPIIAPDGTEVLPPQPNSDKHTTIWRWGKDTINRDQNKLIFLKEKKTNEWRIYTKTWEPDQRGVTPRSLLVEKEHGRNRDGTEEIANILGSKVFKNPKPVRLIKHLLTISSDIETLVVDCFAGSGTTGNAVINLNREDGGKRKYILVEMGNYFDTVTKPRIQKVIYSEEWKDCKPVSRNTGVSQCVKYIRLESYEDTLNNIHLKRTPSQQTLLDMNEAKGADGFAEDYRLRYLLETETRGSPSMLDLDAFLDPDSYFLNIKTPGSDESCEIAVDLVETFNYLLGLTVETIRAPTHLDATFERDSEKRLTLKKNKLTEKPAGAWWFRTVTGTAPDGRNVLVIWRNRPGKESEDGIEQDNLVLNEWFKSHKGWSTKNGEFDSIYVNGTNNLENLKTTESIWKVRLIEEDFKRLMFEGTDA